MSYLELLSLTREPFSNSPDPDAYYAAETHSLCLNRLEIAIRLKRGLNVVLGEVGTGKSTLCRKLVKTLSEKPDFTVFCLLDGGAESAASFLKTLCTHFGVEWDGKDTAEAIDKIEGKVLKLALEEKRQLVLLIDEGQKLTPEALEILRVLLNFETNTEKLLQIVIFAQPEFRAVMDAIPNFRDRVNECLTLSSLSEKESLALLRHRLNLSGGEAAEKLFTTGALKALYKAGNGRPRPMIRLAHQALLGMLMTNKKSVDAGLVKVQAERNDGEPKKSHAVRKTAIGAVVVIVLGAVTALLRPEWLPPAVSAKVQQLFYPATTLPLTDGPAVETGVTVGTPAPATITLAPEPDTAAASAEETPNPSPEPTAAADNPMLGTVTLTAPMSFTEAAQTFYGTKEAEEALRNANPGIAERRSEFVLPELAFRTPNYLLKNSQLSLAEFDTLQAAWDALPALAAFSPRLAARRDAAGQLKFHLLARTSFRKPERAWQWLAQKNPPATLTPKVHPPYGRMENALYAFPE